MAYYNSTQTNTNTSGMNEQDEDEKKNLQPVELSQGISSAPGSENAKGMSNGQVGATPKPAASSGMGGGFQAYTKANQGAAQNRLNQAAVKNVNQQGQQAKAGINQATTEFGQRVNTGSLANRENAVQDVTDITNAARNVTAPAQQAPAPGTTVSSATNPTAQVGQTQQPNQAASAYVNPLNPNQTSRFQQVINAKYQGPESLRQAGLYQLASDKVGKAQTTLDQSKTAQGREEMLRNLFAQRGDYTQGLNKLDASLLNASQSGVQALNQAAQAQGNLGQQLDQAQIGSANLAQNRTQEIQNIQNQAREAFSTGKKAEEAATEERLAAVVKDWDKLPEYFKQIIRNNPKGALNLSAEEAGILGIGSGEGLYNLGENAIKTGVADKSKLISRDEQARQAALANLAGLDLSKRLDTNLLYGDASLAGTQTAMDALDTQGIRNALNQAEQGFRDYAEGATLTGTGMKKNKTSGKKYYASESANLGNLLSNAGYNFDAPMSQQVGNQDILKRLAGVSSGQATPAVSTGLEGAYEGMGQGLETGGGSVGRDALDAYGAATGANAITGALGLGTLTDATTGGINTIMNGGPIPGLNEGLDAIGLGGIAPSNKSIIDALTFGQGSNAISGLVNAVFGGGANSRQSKSIASQLAMQDLQNKVSGALDSSGFQNRANIVDNQQTQDRTAALRALLANMDKTNV